VQNTGFSTNKTLNINGRLINLDIPRVMGIINITPDSFYSGSRANTETQVLRQAEKMLAEGADLIDVGGYSTRPGAEAISTTEETDRVLHAIRAIVKQFPAAAISVDTFRSSVARAAVSEGAGMINDISGGELDPAMFQTVAGLKVPYILMHMRGDPQTMAGLAVYDDLLQEIIRYFHEKLFTLSSLGVKDILIDPGFGFAKTREQNFQLLNQLADLQITGRPIIAGLSRKSMVWKTLAIKPEEALNGTSVLHAVALLNGASLLRVHDVKECAEVIKLISALKTRIDKPA
jgi:dihydropteroate synthase